MYILNWRFFRIILRWKTKMKKIIPVTRWKIDWPAANFSEVYLWPPHAIFYAIYTLKTIHADRQFRLYPGTPKQNCCEKRPPSINKNFGHVKRKEKNAKIRTHFLAWRKTFVHENWKKIQNVTSVWVVELSKILNLTHKTKMPQNAKRSRAFVLIVNIFG